MGEDQEDRVNRMRLHSRALLLFTLQQSLFAQQLTLVQDTLLASDGSHFTGQLLISNPAFFENGQTLVPAAVRNVPVENGRLSVLLLPTDTSSPATLYTVTLLGTGGGPSTQLLWNVPTSASPVTLLNISQTLSAAPFFAGQLDQILKGNGQANGMVASNCQITGASNGDLQCSHTLATGDGTQSGAQDLFGTNGNFVTLTVGGTTVTYVLQLPAAVPVSTGLALKVLSISTTTVNNVTYPLVVLSWQ